MKFRKYVILLTLLYGLFISNSFAKKIELLSPDKITELKIDIGAHITYSVYYHGNKIISESFRANSRKAFNGLCLLVIRSESKQGDIKVTASSHGLKSATVTLKSI